MRYNREKSKDIQKVKIAILSITIALIVIIGSGIMARKVFNYIQTVQATESVSSNQDENTVDNSTGNGSASASASTVTNVASDTPEFVEKYLNQQMKGQMPDGADGVKVVYLTFDDGPSETVTPQILDTLKAKGVHATFFVLGKAIDASDENKALVKRAVSEGHAIGNHSYSHDYNYLYPNRAVNADNFMSDVRKTEQSLKNAIGQDFVTKTVRFPGGHMTWSNMKDVDAIFEKEGYSYIDWNALSKDAEGPKKNAEQLKQETINTVGEKQKAVILMHDTYGKEETAKALPDIIDYFKDKGYEFRVIKE